MMLFVHSVGGVIGALVALFIWASTHTSTEGAILFLTFGSLVGLVVGELVDDYLKKQK